MSTSPPIATVVLADGQTITATVLSRTRNRAGQWWYECELGLYERVDQQPDQPAIASPYPVTFWAPHPLVQPVEGQNYASLDAPRPASTDLWGVEAATTAGAPLRLHIQGCWDANTELTEPISAEQAMTLLRTRQAVHCGCGAGSLASRRAGRRD